MFRVLTTRLNETTFGFVAHHKALCLVIFVISAGLLCFHSFKLINRYLKHDVHLIETVVANTSLHMPVIELWLESSQSNSSVSPAVLDAKVNFLEPLLDGIPIKPWAYKKSTERMQNDVMVTYLIVNQINRDYLNEQHNSIENFLPRWPLESYRFNNFDAGVYIEATISANSSNKFEYAADGSDKIIVRVNPFEANLGTLIGLPEYEILPCEELSISMTLEHYQLKNRSNSPCRDEYPQHIAELIQQPDAKNPAFFALPYDPAVCKILCKNKYSLAKCNCFLSIDAWNYAGKPDSIKLCSNTSLDVSLGCSDITNDVLENCSCHAHCNQTVVRISETQKYSYKTGKNAKTF